MRKSVAAAILLAASLAAPAPAHADCGQDGQPACTGPVPTVDQVTALLNVMTDPNVAFEDKHEVVTPDFQPNNIGWLDPHMNELNGKGDFPFDFVVTDIQPAPNNSAGATVATHANGRPTSAKPWPIVLVNQNGHWLVTLHTAMNYMFEVYNHYTFGHTVVP